MNTTVPILEFDPDLHEYRVNGRRVPGVTEVLRAGGLIDDRWFTTESAWRGSAIHMACQLDDEGTLNPKSVDPSISGELEAYRRFKWEMNFEPQEIEVPHCGLIGGMEVAGRPDRTGILFKNQVVLDLKSGVVSRATALQLAAYSALTGIPGRVAVRLFPEGRYSVEQFFVRDRLRDLRQFQAALTTWWWVHREDKPQ